MIAAVERLEENFVLAALGENLGGENDARANVDLLEHGNVFGCGGEEWTKSQRVVEGS